MKVTKRNGNVVIYDDEKIIQSILAANACVKEEEISEKTAAYIAGAVFARLSGQADIFSTADVRREVYRMLLDKNYFLTAQKFMAFKKA